jgi:hypothetical protein
MIVIFKIKVNRMKETIKGSLTISRPTCGDGREYISIQVKDVTSRVRFLEVEISYAEFTACLTGLSETRCDLVVRGLQNVGKTKETDRIMFEMPKHNYNDTKEVAILEAQKNTPKGWECDTYFGSQGSFYQKNGRSWATTLIYRWV